MATGGIDQPLYIITDEGYFNGISNKDIGGIPEFLNYDNGFPLGTIRLWPAPTTGHVLHLLTEKQLTQFASLDTELSLPPGYERALINNLAVETAPDYGQPVSRDLDKIARESKSSIRSAIAKSRTMDAQPEVGNGEFNIYRGW